MSLKGWFTQENTWVNQPHVITNLSFFLSFFLFFSLSEKKKKDILKNVGKQTFLLPTDF